MKGLPPNLLEGMPSIAKNTQTVLEKRYLDKRDDGTLKEDVDDMYWRVASTLAANGAAYGASTKQIHQDAVSYFTLMRGNLFLPNSPTLANAGTRTGQLSACFVLPVGDALSNKQDGIYDTLTKAQLIFQTGGGVGYAFSRLRRKGGLVGSTKGQSSGPMSFMDVYNAACGSIAQGGMRRGAQMGILRVDHPDILAFIGYKEDLTKLTNFNVSVGITDAFLTALENGSDYELIDPKDGPTGTRLKAVEVWAQIIKRAWSTGEPGVVFLDRMNRYNPTPLLGPYEATNPCGEQPLNPYESCNLGSITLDQFVKHNIQTGKKEFDWEMLRKVVFTAIALMDDVVDVNRYVPGVPEIRETTLATRKLGLGVMGQARMLFKMGLAYDSEAGRELSEKVYAFIDATSKLASQQRAKERGVYPYFEQNREASIAFHSNLFMERVEKLVEADEASNDPGAFGISFQDIADFYREAEGNLDSVGMRNSTTTTVAPTGTLSIIHNTSGGCEPEFALVISRWQADTEMFEANPVFEAELRELGFAEETVQRIYATLGRNKGSLVLAMSELLRDPSLTAEQLIKLQGLSKIYVTAGDISPTDHVLMQARMQKYCDSAISKTINFPQEATVEQVREAYDLAIQSGCKGITIYRDGCRAFQPLTAGDKKAEKAEVKTEPNDEAKASLDQYAARIAGQLEARKPRKRDEDLYGFTRRVETGDGKLYVTANYDAEGLREVVLNVGKSGGVLNALVESLGRVISIALQHHTPVADIAKQLVGVRGGVPFGFGPKQVLSLPDAVGRVLNAVPSNLLEVLSPVEAPAPVEVTVPSEKVMTAETRRAMIDEGHSPDCPECGSPLAMAEGCVTCMSCGYSRCS